MVEIKKEIIPKYKKKEKKDKMSGKKSNSIDHFY